MRDEIIKNNKLMQVKTVTIMTTRHTEYNARVLERLLSPLGLQVQVLLDSPRVYNDDLYIVLCSQAFESLPPPMKRIVFQLEQSGRADWFTDAYMNDLSQSLAVFDYSSDNIQFLQNNGMSYRDIFELTIAPIADYMPKSVAKSPDFDVLFYGAYNDRRNKILERLGKEFRVKSVCEVYGEEMRDIIRTAPVVVNIHFYENALLETTRISEALSLGARVVSERGIDEDKNRDFAPCVRFCPMDDVDALVAAIKAELAEAGSPVLPIDLMAQASFRFYRALLAIGMIDYAQFHRLTEDYQAQHKIINANLLKDPSYTATAIENLIANGSSNKVAVFYHYFERDEAYRDNLVLFLATGYSPDVDFYIIIASECSIDLPQKPNIIYIHAENKNYDYGGYCQALAHINDIDKYDACIFINSSVRGPFVASYFQDDWTKIYTQCLKDDVHLVGATINAMAGDCPEFDFLTTDYHYPKPYSHVQSTTYAISRKALQHLLKIGFYDDTDEMPKIQTIALYELRLSQEIKKQGWNMKSLCAPYNSIDYRTTHEEINPTAVNGDSLYAGAFFGRTLSPLECVFMKINRDIFASADNTRSLASYTYTSLMTNTHPDMADWQEAQQLYKSAEIAMQGINSSPSVPPKSPFRIFGIIYRSLKKKINSKV